MIQTNFQQNILRLAIGIAAALCLTVIGSSATATAQENRQQGGNQQQQQNQNKNRQPASGNYRYSAQPGDSYSLMSRKAIQTYGIVNKINLSKAEIIAAETNLTQELGSKQLNRGQQVTVPAASVQKWVEAAQKLSPQQEAAWQTYVPSANFNTNSVGQAG